MGIELELGGLKFLRQVPAAMLHRDRVIGDHRIDLIVESAAVVELKSVERFDPVFEAQILTYWRLAKIKVGRIINFHSRLLHDGMRRFVL
jgi:GxxExxY protein